MKENPISRILGLVFKRVLLGISNLGMDIISFGLNLHVFGLKDHIPNCKGVLGGLVFHWWLSFLTHPSPFRNFGIK